MAFHTDPLPKSRKGQRPIPEDQIPLCEASRAPTLVDESSTKSGPARRDDQISFLDLPPEIRVIIYEHCLIVGNIHAYEYATNNLGQTNHCHDPGVLPASTGLVSLLQTCRMIRTECKPTVYSKNSFVLPAGHLPLSWFEKGLHNENRRSWVKSLDVWWPGKDLTCDDQVLLLDRLVAAEGNDHWIRWDCRIF